jgi:hypothetical protein
LVIGQGGYHGVSTKRAEKPVEKRSQSRLDSAFQATLRALNNALCNRRKYQKTLSLEAAVTFGKNAGVSSVNGFPQRAM